MAGEFAVGVVPAAQQGAQPVDLPGQGGGQFLAGDKQDAQRFTVTVRAGHRQPVNRQVQRSGHRAVGVDRVGFAGAPAGLGLRWLALDHTQPRRGHRAGQPHPVAAAALDRDHQPGAGGVLADPAEQLGVTGGVVGDLAGGDRGTTRVSDLGGVGVAVGVDTDHGIDHLPHPHRFLADSIADSIDGFCNHGSWPGPLLGSGSQRSAPAWVEGTERHICDGSRPTGGQAFDQASR